RRFNRHGAVDPSRLELRRQVVWLKGTPKRLERGIACVRQYVHPGRLIGTVTPEVLMCIDDETHRMPPMALRMLPQSPERPLRPVCAENQILIGDGDRAANGHVAAAPLSSVMNSPRFTFIGGVLPPWRRRSVYRTLNLPHDGRQVLGTNLN